MKIKKEIKEIEVIEYDGLRFYRSKQGYWVAGNKLIGKRRMVRLHIYVWEKYNSEVPKGYHVHHIDRDKDNNDIQNLNLIDSKEHYKYHANLRDKEKIRENLNNNVRPKAIEWHKSSLSKEFHKSHYEKMKDKFHKRVDIECLVCGKKVNVGLGGAVNKFCSNNCKSQYRRGLKTDNIERICIICNETFANNKYSKSRTCSLKCGWELRRKKE